MLTRRTLLVAAGLSGAAYAGFKVIPRAFPPSVDFTALADPPGFRSVGGGDFSSGSFNAFVGLDGGDTEVEEQLVSEQNVRDDLCGALYGTFDPDSSQIPIAAFSDYYCPFCRIQTRNLAALVERNAEKIAIKWHELPLLGDASEAAARAALAAGRQGRYAEFQESLIRTPFVANDGYIEALAERIGVDHEQLLRDIASDTLTRELQTTAMLARIFGFIGTPAMVIGRTVVMGEISDRQIFSIVELERNEGWTVVC
jgi:protein-disulfide isomerase